MPRPRSIFASIGSILVRAIRRHPIALAIVACAAIVWSRRAPQAPVTRAVLQTAVLRDGFVATHAAGDQRRIVELDQRGGVRKDLKIAVAGDARVVGTGAGTAVAWQEGKRLRLAAIGGRDLGLWGKSVRYLCDGVASSDARFGVAWLEADQSVWMVHGSVGSTLDLDLDTVSDDQPARQIDWCGIATADDNIALIWRESNQLKWVSCTQKKCGGVGASVKLAKQATMLGIGCAKSGCMFASRDASGASLSFASGSGKPAWTVPLPTDAPTVSIVGIGGDAFAVGVVIKDGARVARFDRKSEGNGVIIWRDSSTAVPSLAWSSGKLLVAHGEGAGLTAQVVPVSR